MTMNERIEQAAREIASRYNKSKDGFGNNVYNIGYEACCLEMANWLLSHQWISVDEELPPYEEKDKQYSIDVIARCYDGTSMYNDYAYYDFVNETWCSLTRDCSFGPVTHWMEIPNMEHN